MSDDRLRQLARLATQGDGDAVAALRFAREWLRSHEVDPRAEAGRVADLMPELSRNCPIVYACLRQILQGRTAENALVDAVKALSARISELEARAIAGVLGLTPEQIEGMNRDWFRPTQAGARGRSVDDALREALDPEQAAAFDASRQGPPA